MDTLKALNVWSRSDEKIGRDMSNFAHYPIVVDGIEFGSVESFWTCLYYADNEKKREKIRPMWGARSKREAPNTKPEYIVYCGETIKVGSEEHLGLMKRAIRIKLEAYPEIAFAFVATRPREIVHELEWDSKKHPRFCRILTELREEFAVRLA